MPENERLKIKSIVKFAKGEREILTQNGDDQKNEGDYDANDTAIVDTVTDMPGLVICLMIDVNVKATY